MIDIHSHIVWGVDDGAQNLSDSLAMLKMAAETGTTDIVATPHADTKFKFDAKLIAERIRELSAATQNIPRIHQGCDFHLSLENVQSALVDPSQFTINGMSYLMVEFADNFISPSTEGIFRQLTDRGIVPVITHPERNPISAGFARTAAEVDRDGMPCSSHRTIAHRPLRKTGAAIRVGIAAKKPGARDRERRSRYRAPSAATRSRPRYSDGGNGSGRRQPAARRKPGRGDQRGTSVGTGSGPASAEEEVVSVLACTAATPQIHANSVALAGTYRLKSTAL